MTNSHDMPGGLWRLPLAGAVALLLGVGFGRYVFTPLITPLVESGWFTAEQTARLGAINLLGYLIGAAGANRYAGWLGPRRAIASCLIALVISLVACAWPWAMIVYGFWRLIAGAAAATLTIVVTPAIMARMPAARRPLASATIFTGIGVGTMGVSLLVPRLASAGIGATWLATAGVGAVLAWISWLGVWRHLPAEAAPGDDTAAAPSSAGHTPWVLIGLVVAAYGLSAAGYVPHSLYWVDYIARELGRGLEAGNRYWLLLGLGGVIGPALAGITARWLGFERALVAAFVLMTLATALPLALTGIAGLGLSSLVVGAMVPAIITLTAGTVHALSPVARQRQIWGWATLSFAATQAVGGFAMARLYAFAGSYATTIAAGAVILVVATGCSLAGAIGARRRALAVRADRSKG